MTIDFSYVLLLLLKINLFDSTVVLRPQQRSVIHNNGLFKKNRPQKAIIYYLELGIQWSHVINMNKVKSCIKPILYTLRHLYIFYIFYQYTDKYE